MIPDTCIYAEDNVHVLGAANFTIWILKHTLINICFKVTYFGRKCSTKYGLYIECPFTVVKL